MTGPQTCWVIWRHCQAGRSGDSPYLRVVSRFGWSLAGGLRLPTAGQGLKVLGKGWAVATDEF